jgi:transcriptional regulator with XRE-family HTH domain
VARPITSKLKREKNTPEQAFGALVTVLRAGKGWSQAEFARRLGYDPSYVGRVERGRQSPTLRFIAAVARPFGLRPSQLLAQAERKQAPKQS